MNWRHWATLVVLLSLLCPGLVLRAQGGLPRPPLDHLQPEKAWIKEDGLPRETWDQYNDTGPNRLNLTYRHSAVNVAYVIRSSDPDDEINTTFIVYRNESGSNGFNASGYLFPGSTPSWTVTISLSSKQTQGEYTYHLFIATYDPEGVPGIYQVRINITGTISGGSSWTEPDGNSNVPWMFFEVPTGTTWPLSVSDQLGRFSPFFFETPIPSTHFNASMIVVPPGNSTGATTAHVKWNHTNGSTIFESDVPIYYAGEGKWAAQSVVIANITNFPLNYTHPYKVQMTLGSYERAAQFFVYPIYAALLPETWIYEAPPAETENTTVTFAWIGSDLDGSVTGYHYRLGLGDWIATTDTSRVFSGLSNGTYSFEVRSVDDDGLVDNTPAKRQFSITINSPPETHIIDAPNTTTQDRDATFTWQGSDVDGAVTSYDYRLDSADWIYTIYTTTTVLNLSSGNHTFEVRARDNRGLVDPTPAVFAFTVLPTPCEKEVMRLTALVEELESRVSELEEEVANLTDLLAQATTDNEVLQAAIQLLESEKEELSALVQTLQDERSELVSQIAELESEKDALQSELWACGNITALLQAQLVALNQTVNQLITENMQLQISNEFLVGLVERLRQRIVELEAQVPEAFLIPATFLLLSLPSIKLFARNN